MEAFHLFPQNPHFRPLDILIESAHERHTIYKMVDFSDVFEKMCHLQHDNPRIEIIDKLETLLELETHGFDIDYLRNRLTEMLYWKEKPEALETEEQKDNLVNERVKVKEQNGDVVLIDSQIGELHDKREQLVKENKKSIMKIVTWEEEVDEIEEANSMN